MVKMGFGDNDMESDEKLDRILEILMELRSRPAPRPQADRAPFASGGGSSAGLLPNYGRAKGQPIAGASLGDLQYYAEGCRKSLNDPDKGRFHAKETAMLAELEAELGKHGR